MSSAIAPSPRNLKSTPSPSPAQITVRHGSCLCGAIQYELTGEPFTVYVCHCTNCRKTSGSAFTSDAFFRPKDVRMFQGEGSLRKYHDANTKSGNVMERQFCKKCGASLFLRPLREGADVIIVCAGTIDGDVDWLVERQLFAEETRSWVGGISMQKRLSNI